MWAWSVANGTASAEVTLAGRSGYGGGVDLRRAGMGSSGRQTSPWVTNGAASRGEPGTINSVKTARRKQFGRSNRPSSSLALPLRMTLPETSVFPSADWDSQTKSVSAGDQK